jgi:hypothetical protein
MGGNTNQFPLWTPWEEVGEDRRVFSKFSTTVFSKSYTEAKSIFSFYLIGLSPFAKEGINFEDGMPYGSYDLHRLGISPLTRAEIRLAMYNLWKDVPGYPIHLGGKVHTHVFARYFSERLLAFQLIIPFGWNQFLFLFRAYSL